MATTSAPPHYPPPTFGTLFPRGGPLGLLPEVGREAIGLLPRCRRQFGGLVRIRLGLTRTIVLGHPDLACEVLVTGNGDYQRPIHPRC